MRNIKLVGFIIALCIILCGCKETTEVKNYTYRINDSDIDRYYDTIVSILSNSEIKNTDLISESLREYIQVLKDSKSGMGLGNEGYDTENNEHEEIEEKGNDNLDRFPVIDDYGTIYKYGTEEESSKSYERFNQLPVYELMNSTIQNGKIYLKVMDREYVIVRSLILYINDDGTIDKFEEGGK